MLADLSFPDLDNEQLDEIEQKTQAKNQESKWAGNQKVREMVWGKINYSGSQNSKLKS